MEESTTQKQPARAPKQSSAAQGNDQLSDCYYGMPLVVCSDELRGINYKLIF